MNDNREEKVKELRQKFRERDPNFGLSETGWVVADVDLGEDTVPILIDFLKAPDEEMRDGAIWALIKLIAAEDEEAVRALLKLLKEDKSERVRADVAFMFHMGEKTEEIEQALVKAANKDKSKIVRKAAAETLEILRKYD